MNKTYYKQIPFNVETAKKITSGEKKGEIITRSGKKVRILAFDVQNGTFPIFAAIKQNSVPQQEIVSSFTNEGKYEKLLDTPQDLFIRVPTYYKDYTNFKPAKWQPCVVRSTDDGMWFVAVCDKEIKSGEAPTFYPSGLDKLFRSSVAYRYYLPLTKVTQRLLRQAISYEQLIERIDMKSYLKKLSALSGEEQVNVHQQALNKTHERI